jgi:hypothetical protein
MPEGTVSKSTLADTLLSIRDLSVRFGHGSSEVEAVSGSRGVHLVLCEEYSRSWYKLNLLRSGVIVTCASAESAPSPECAVQPHHC